MTVKLKNTRRGGMLVTVQSLSGKLGRNSKTGVIVKGKAAAKPAAAKSKFKVCNLNEFLVVSPITEEDRRKAYRSGRFAEMTAKQAGLTN